LVCHTKGRT